MLLPRAFHITHNEYEGKVLSILDNASDTWWIRGEFKYGNTRFPEFKLHLWLSWLISKSLWFVEDVVFTHVHFWPNNPKFGLKAHTIHYYIFHGQYLRDMVTAGRVFSQHVSKLMGIYFNWFLILCFIVHKKFCYTVVTQLSFILSDVILHWYF